MLTKEDMIQHVWESKKYRVRRLIKEFQTRNGATVVWRTFWGDCEQRGPLNDSDLRSFDIWFEFESNFRFGIRFVLMIWFEILESSAPSIVLCKETIGGG